MFSRKKTGLRRMILAALVATSAAARLGAQISSRVVAYSGMPAPGASPATFDNFNHPAIAPQGEIVFRGRLVAGSNTYGLWREAFDQATAGPLLKLVLREGQDSPVAGFKFSGFPGPPTIGLPGRIAFKTHIQSGSTFHDTLWTERPAPDGLTLEAREGAPAPGVAGGSFGVLFNNGYDPLLLDDLGATLYAGRLTGAGINTANDTGLWYDNGTTTFLVGREGSPMPGVSAGHNFANDSFLTPDFVSLGGGVFVFYATDGDPTSPIRGLWSNHSNSVQPLILEGGSAPGLAADESLTLISSFRINHLRQVAFGGLISKQGGGVFRGVWISDPTGAFQLAARSDTAPGGRVPPVAVFTDGGHVFGVDDIGRLARVTTAGLTVLAKPDDPAPGAGAGVLFASIPGVFASGDGIAANSAGQVAFEAVLKGSGVNLANDRGLFALDDKLQLVKVVREGETIEAPAGSPRTISAIEFALGSGSGQPRSMSDKGEVVWKASVVGLPAGSQVVAVTGVGAPPEPPRLVGLEVVQVVQNWRNEIPLIAGKKTVVRAHVTSAKPTRFVGRLRAFAGSPAGAELPGSPLDAANPGGYAPIDANSNLLRERLGASAYFELPESWASGTVTLRLEWAEGSLTCRELAGPVDEDCEAGVTFVPAEVPQVRFRAVDYLQGAPATVRHLGVDVAADMARRLISAYPIANLSWSFGTLGMIFPAAPTTDEITDQILPLVRATEGCTAAVGCKSIYYGAIPGDTIDGLATVPGTSGSVGSGYVPDSPTAPGRHTHTHEIGHNLNRHHSVHSSVAGAKPGEKKGNCGEVADAAAPDFPNWFLVTGRFRATLGPMTPGASNALVYGFDTDLKLVVDPNQWFDLMGYCASAPIDFWPADETYRNLHTAIDARFGPPPSPVSAEVLAGDYFVVRGRVDLESDEVDLHPFSRLLQAPAPDAPPAGAYALRLRDAGGALLEEIAFEPTETAGRGPHPKRATFLIGVPADAAIRRVEILHEGFVLVSRNASAHAPTVQVTSPNGGENLNASTVNLQWTGSDADGDPLTYVVQYSPDNGATWITLGVDVTETHASVLRSSLPGSSQARLRVLASDGFLTGSDTSNAVFTVANNPPAVSMGNPDDGRLYTGDQLVLFDALSFDPEEGNLPGSALAWSSSLDGALGTGAALSRKASTLTPGTHVITITATDGQAGIGTDIATIRIGTTAPDPLTDLGVSILDPDVPVLAGSSPTYTIQATNNGPEGASAVSITLAATLDPDGPAGAGPAPILSVAGTGWSCTPGSGTATCTRSALDPLADAAIAFQVSAAQTGSLTVTAEIAGAEEDAAGGNDAAEAITGVGLPAADLSVTKTHSPPTPLGGHDLTYTITVRNSGPAGATGVTSLDTLPAGVSFVSAKASQGACTGTSTVSCNLGSLAPGVQATVTIVVNPAATGVFSNNVSVTSSGQSDPAPADNQASDTATVVAGNEAFGVRIAQVFGGTPAAPDAQYVMLQLWADGQTGFSGRGIDIAAVDGVPINAFHFPPGTVLANGQSQDTVLIATDEAEALFNVTADLKMTPVLGGGGKVCWAETTDCVSLGAYTGPDTGTGAPFSVAEWVGLAVTRRMDIAGSHTALDPADDTNQSARDFILALPAPRNNARQNGTPPASTCGNHALEGLEGCDDGNTASGDGCSSLCFQEPGPVMPVALAADPAAGSASDGNGVLEPGETVSLRGSWRNDEATASETRGAAALFTGPAGSSYSLLDGLADYGEISPGSTSGCVHDCFELRLAAAGARPEARPSTHWDSSIDEVVSGGARVRRPIHVGDSFSDVPRGYLFYRRVETVLHHGITAGCSATQYCPNDKVRRDQMGLFLARAIAHGGANVPASGSVGGKAYSCALGGISLFSDVAPTDSTCRAIHYIAAQNVTGGCGGGAFCVSSNVTRAEMGLFVARGLVAPNGGAAVPASYGPDPVTGRSYSCSAASPNLNFTDVAPADSFCRHVHYLWARGIVSGCSATQYCVAGEVSRGEMARFLSNAFAPNLYGP